MLDKDIHEQSLTTAKPRLSAIIITKNEAKHIAACLTSLRFVDEIIVLDSGSTDATCEIARSHGAIVHVTTDWPGFGPQKNRALDLSSGQWILSIDADERVPDALAQEIVALLANVPANDAYEIGRLSHFCGQPIHHSGWHPDYVLRLFRRGKGRFTEAKVHEKVISVSAPGKLKHSLLHYPYDSLESLLEKVNRYSTDAAQMMYDKGKRTSIIGAVGHGIWTLIRIYVLRRGFMDGKAGLIIAIAAGAGSFFRYAKLLILQENKNKSSDR